jgi:isopenicillin N synthase-like dioxygenase
MLAQKHNPATEKDMVELPAIDMSEPDEVIVPQMMEMMTTLGFLHLKNCEGFDEAELLADIKEFHGLSDDVKRELYRHQFNAENDNYYFGMHPVIDNDASHKEIFDMGPDYREVCEEEKNQVLMEETPFPKDTKYDYLRAKYNKHYEMRHRIGLRLLELIAIGLGKEKNFFHEWFAHSSLSILRTIRYPPRSQSSVKSDQLSSSDYKLTTPPHNDSGFITILTTFGYPGLQVLIDGEYRSVKPEPGHFVVNLGKTFEHITNLKLKATYHQVLDIGVERYSSPYFLEPKSSAVIPSNLLDEREESKQETIVYGLWLSEAMKRFGEWKNFKRKDEE